MKRCPTGQGILFAPSIAGGKTLTARANVMGIKARWVDGNTPQDERERAVDDYREKRIRLLINYACFTEGFDAPGTAWIGIARGVSSTSAWLQMTGRGLRIDGETGKTVCTVSDLLGVTELHGLPHADRVYSLSGRAIQLAHDPDEKDTVQCPGCLSYFLGKQFKTSVCPWCGYERRGRMDPAVRHAIMVEKLSAHTDTKKTEKLRTLVDIACRKNYKLGWVMKQFQIRYGYRPSREMLSNAGFWVAVHRANGDARRKGPAI